MRKIYVLFSVLLLLSISNVLKAQNRTVSGTVLDEKSEPLPGVTVQVKGSKAATITDVNGKYAIKVTNLQDVVVGVSFVGYTYQSKTLKVGEMNADFKMALASTGLDEVVVVGYGTQKKATLTGAVETINVKNIEDFPSLNLTSSLVGQVPALNAVQDARPGQPASITIRNPIEFNGAHGTTEPIYIIDDIKRTNADFNALDPNEIASISILKDAEASIYGVSGGNGAILVRTKKGLNGAPKISFSSSFGTADAMQLPKMMSGIQLATWLNDYNQMGTEFTSTGAPTGNSLDVNGYVNGVPTNKNTSWYTPDELAYIANPANNFNYLKSEFKPANNEREALNISGGSDKATYFIGADYVNQNSNFSGVNSNKWGVRANVETKPAKGLTIDLNLSEDQMYSRSFWYKTHGTTESLNQDVASLLSVQPWQKYTINGYPVDLQSNATYNFDNDDVMLYQQSNNFTQTLNYSTNLLGKVTYEIPGIQGLSAGFTVNDNINNGFPEQYGTNFNYYRFAGLGDNHHIPGGTMNIVPVPIANGDYVAIDPTYNKAYQIDANINYQHSFGKNHITALAIYEQLGNNINGVTTQAQTTIAGGLPNINYTTGATSANQANSQVAESGEISYIGRLNYDYDNTYIAQATFRRDGTTSFAPGLQYGNFGSFSIGYVASNTAFIKDNFTFINILKLRASIGSVGSDQTVAYQYLTQYNPTTGGSSAGAVFDEGERGTGIKSVGIANPNTTWDHQTKTDYGVDMEFLKSRLSVTGDYYWNHGYDMLTGLSGSVPFTIGNQVPTENFASVNTFGYEISLGWRDHISNNWGYHVNTFFTWSDDKNIREDISQGLVGTVQDHKGESDDQGVYGFESLGIIRTQAQANQIIAQRAAAAGGSQNVKIFGETPQPGMINYADLNGDGIVENTDTKDEKYLNHKQGNHHSMGLNFGFNYKSLSLNVVTGMSWGGINTLSSSDINDFSGVHDITENKGVFWADHWTPTNTNAKYPAPYWTTNYDVTSNFWFVSSFSANIQNANLSYTLPSKWTKTVGISSARLYVVCTNVLQLFNPWPDQFSNNGSPYTYPLLRTISLGVNVGL